MRGVKMKVAVQHILSHSRASPVPCHHHTKRKQNPKPDVLRLCMYVVQPKLR